MGPIRAFPRPPSHGAGETTTSPFSHSHHLHHHHHLHHTTRHHHHHQCPHIHHHHRQFFVPHSSPPSSSLSPSEGSHHAPSLTLVASEYHAKAERIPGLPFTPTELPTSNNSLNNKEHGPSLSLGRNESLPHAPHHRPAPSPPPTLPQNHFRKVVPPGVLGNSRSPQPSGDEGAGRGPTAKQQLQQQQQPQPQQQQQQSEVKFRKYLFCEEESVKQYLEKNKLWPIDVGSSVGGRKLNHEEAKEEEGENEERNVGKRNSVKKEKRNKKSEPENKWKSLENEPSATSLPFPFSDDEDDGTEENSDDGEGRESHEKWTISDIVETEDEEGEVNGEEEKECDHDGKERDTQNSDGASQDATNLVSVGVISAVRIPEVQQQPPPEVQQQQPRIPEVAPPWRAEGEGEEDDCSLEGSEGEEDNGKTKEGVGEAPKDSVRATQRLRPRSYRQFLLTRERRSRVFLKARSYHLGRWFVTHFTHPYPTKEQKDMLAARTNMTRNQVSEWFGNMRRRIREATRGLGVCWEERVRVYNSVITGKSEPLPILPGDAINTWTPPVPQDPTESSGLDTSEEVAATPKFKTTLLHRYLSHSFDAHPPPEAQVSSSIPSSTSSATMEEARVFLHTTSPSASSVFLHTTTSSISSTYCRVLPLCTSSPKGDIQALWSSSFEHVKDDLGGRAETRKTGREDGWKGRKEEGRASGRMGVQGIKRTCSDSFEPLKKPRLGEVSEEWQITPSISSTTFSSTKTPRRVEVWEEGREMEGRWEERGRGEVWEESSGRRWKEEKVNSIMFSPTWSTRSTIQDLRSSDNESPDCQHVRQPEELAAAYTLMQLQHM